ncbi:MAG TPA: hypothetical protein VEU07_01300, partial [Candidatus Acidoferrum sp.]|nr:hypothetical protein [Candidatus Acidoferrum sp.]
MSRFLAVVVEAVVPGLLTAVLGIAQRLGWISLLPGNPVVAREYGLYGLVLGVAGAIVTSGSYLKPGREYGFGAFVCTAMAWLVMASPFIAWRYGMQFGLAPMQFALLGTLAYIGLY